MYVIRYSYSMITKLCMDNRNLPYKQVCIYIIETYLTKVSISLTERWLQHGFLKNNLHCYLQFVHVINTQLQNLHTQILEVLRSDFVEDSNNVSAQQFRVWYFSRVFLCAILSFGQPSIIALLACLQKKVG